MQPTRDLNQLVRQAEADFAAGRHREARVLLEEVLRSVPGQPAILHLYGLVLSRLGDGAGAKRALTAAYRASPGDPQIANSLGNLLDRIGEPEAALAAYEAAIRSRPDFTPSHLNRVTTLDALGRYAEARQALAHLVQTTEPTADMLVAGASIERNSGDLAGAAQRLDVALQLDPAHGIARRGRARLSLEMGEPEAAARYRAALAAEPDRRELLLDYVAVAETVGERQATLARIAAMLLNDPGWLDGHRTLSKARREDGEFDPTANLETALTVRPRDGELWKVYVEQLGRADDHAGAAEVCLRAERATGDPAFAVGAVSYLSAAGEIDAADALTARLPAGSIAPGALAKHALRKRDPAAAEPLLAAAIDLNPDDIEAWALRGIVWQMLGDTRSEWLNGQDGLVGITSLDVGEGDIAAIAGRLRAIHATARQRIGQSVRGGTQTADNLFDRREPEVVHLRGLIGAAIARHVAGMPPADPAHPILRHRDGPLAFAGSWSIRLTGGGFHVQHIHPRGVLSAASYWAVPEPEPRDPHAGWLELGGAPAYLALDLEPRQRIEPKAGRLVLFPSTLHHGTRPFPAGERMSVAFDIVTARKAG